MSDQNNPQVGQSSGQLTPNEVQPASQNFTTDQTLVFNSANTNSQNSAEISQKPENQPTPGQTNISFDTYTPDLGTPKNENITPPSSEPEEKGSRLGTVITIILMIIIAVGIWYTNKDNQELVSSDNENPIVVDDTKEEGQVNIVDNNSPKPDITGPTVKITAYYNKLSTNECENVIPLEREVEKKYDSDVINTVRGLLTPLTNEELNQGWISSIPDQTYLKSVTIKDGVAQASFSATLNQVAGSCRVLAIRSQIEKTLLQFPYIKSVIICIDNNCQQDEILQP